MKKKRIVACLSFVIMLFSLCLPVTAHAESGCWELTYTLEYLAPQDVVNDYFYGSDVHISGGEGQFSFSETLTENAVCNNDHYHDWDHKHIGETFSGTLSFSQPGAVCIGGKALTFDLQAYAEGSRTFCEASFYSLCVEVMPVAAEERMQFGTGDAAIHSIYSDYISRSYCLKSDDGEYSAQAYMSGEYCEEQTAKTNDAVLKHEMPTSNPGDTLYYMVLFENANVVLGYTIYEYTYRGSEVVPPIGFQEGENSIEPIEPDDRYVDTDANNHSGEMSIAVPAAIGAVLVSGGLIAIKNRKKKKPQQKTEQKEECSKEKQEEKNKEKRYEMRIYKDFGNTLYVGRSVTVSARMVEVTPDGREQDCPELTAKLRISSPKYLEVSGETLRGRYMTANIKAPGNSSAPERAAVSFAIVSDNGSFTNNVWFKIAGNKIVFAQEELILPAKHEKETRLPFGVGGATAASIVTAVIEPQGVYDVAVEPGDDPQVFYAVITEHEGISGKDKDAGEHEDYTLHIKARLSADNEHELMGSLPISRFFMGLCVDLGRNYVGCYLEPKAHRKGLEPAKLKMRDLEPSVTRLRTALFTWDEAEHTLLCVPIVPSSFEIVPENERDTAAREHIQKMQIDCTMERVTKFKDYSFAEGSIVCTAAVLDAPLRHKALMRIKAEYGGKSYTHEEKLALLSQPYREMGADNLAKYQKEDAKLLHNLQRIQIIIDRDGYYQNLYPLYKLIDTMQDAYKVEFGFDPHQYELCRDVFDRFMRGDLLGANAKPEVVTLADEMYLFITATLDKAVEVEDSMGFMRRMALGVITFGMADAAFTGLRVMKEMNDYAENGGDSVLEGFYIGAKIVSAEYITDKLMGRAMTLGGKGLRKSAEIPSVKNALDKGKNSSQELAKKLTGYDFSAKAKRVSQRMQASKDTKANADARGQRAMEFNRTKLSPDDATLQKAYQDGLDIGHQKVKDLRASYELMQMNPTPENINMFRKITKDVQADEYAMYEMMKRQDIPEVCAAFNRQLDVTYQATDRQVREMLARKYQVPVEDVEVFCASSKDKADLLSGKKITKDRDVSLKINGEYIPQAEAEQIYQQSLRDNLSGGRIDRNYTQTDLRELDAKLDRQAGKRYDQAVVQKTSMENYGNENDLRRMVNPDYHKEALDDAVRVSNTVKYKGQEWLEQGYAAAEDGDLVTALAKRKEGMRQTLKQFKIADGRNTARFVENGRSMISDDLRTQMAVVEQCIEDYSISPSTVDSTLKAMGTTFEEVLEQVADLFPAIG